MNDNSFYLNLGNGISKIYTNDKEGALKAFNDAIKSQSNGQFDKRHAIAFHLRGNVYSLMGKYADGISDRKKAMEIDPVYEKFYNDLGNKFAEMDRNAIDNISISIGDNFKKVFSEFSSVQETLKWIKENIQNGNQLRNNISDKEIRKAIDELSKSVEYHKIVFSELSEVEKLRIDVSVFLRELYPKKQINPNQLSTINDKMKNEGRAFLKNKLGNSLQSGNKIKEVFRKERTSKRKHGDEYVRGKYDLTDES